MPVLVASHLGLTALTVYLFTHPLCRGEYSRPGRELSPVVGGGGGVLPYFSYVGICRPIGYGVRGALSSNRVSFLALCSFDRVSKSQALLKT